MSPKYILRNIFYIVVVAKFSNALRIDNTLVTAKNDCFERIALGAMLPFEKTFQNSDTNSLRLCEEMCMRVPECQTFAFGITPRGNGTCQLSSEEIDGTQKRPQGTIFDPDFDLYQRRSNCGLHDLATVSEGGPNPGPPFSQSTPSGRPQNPFSPANGNTDPPHTTTIGGSSGSDTIRPTYDPTTTQNQRPVSEEEERYSPRPTFPGSDRYPETSRYPAEDRYTSTERYPTKDRYPSTSKYPYEGGNTVPDQDKYGKPYSPRPRPTDNNRPSNSYPPPQTSDKFNFYQDIYHNYQFPMLYEQNYPLPNEKNGYPGTYAENVTPVDNKYYRPTYSGGSSSNNGSPYSNKDKYPYYGAGGGSTSSYGPLGTDYLKPDEGYRPVTTYKPVHEYHPTENGQSNGGYDQGAYGHRPSGDRPPSNSHGQGGYDSKPNGDASYGSRPGQGSYDKKPYGQGSYGNRPTGDDNNQGSYGSKPYNNGYGSNKPSSGYGGQGNGYDNLSPSYGSKPGLNTGYGQGQSSYYGSNKPQSNGDQGYGQGVSNKPSISNEYKPGGPSSSGVGYSEGNYHQQHHSYHGSSGPVIETYFNPDDYMYPGKPESKPGALGGGYGGVPAGGYGTCFRRVLAGKRVATHWVRRTLTCERPEDCQKACGEEKRFTCEGFNYRIDPSGRGQGTCELIDVPLSEMDLYSSPLSRDENLSRHPDYDYFERDRNACKPNPGCTECSVRPYRPSSAVDYFRPTTYRPDKYKPSYPDQHPPSSLIGPGGYTGSSVDRYYPDTAIDKYRPPIYESRPPPDFDRYDYHSSSFGSYSSGGGRPPTGSGYGSEIDRYDTFRPIGQYRPGYVEVTIPISHGYLPDEPHNKPYKQSYSRPEEYGHSDSFHGSHHTSEVGHSNEYFPFKPSYESSYPPSYHKPSRPEYFPSHESHNSHRPHGYLDRDPPLHGHNKPFIPYQIGQDNSWGAYGGNYGGSYGGNSNYHKFSQDYWGLKNDVNRKDGPHFNYMELSGHKGDFHGDNYVWSYPGSKYGHEEKPSLPRDKIHYGSLQTLWTRRPGQDECSVKSSEGFRLHKGVIRLAYSVPTVTDCERMCWSENKFQCVTYSYRYSPVSRDNCLLCDRPINLLDFYADIEPDRDYDIYAMTDDVKMCSKQIPNEKDNNAQCFFRAIDSTRFFKSIVRDSLTVRSIGECELECIKSHKFTCRAFSFRYGARSSGGVIDNCQLSDWPVRDMDKDRHLVHDTTFDVFERASYGHGCEIQPIVDEKHKKLCYLGYGSPGKLLSSAIKKVTTVQTELECKNECIRFRENSPFKCYSFSFGAHASSYNCEMSDLDQSELKLNIHYTHTGDRDYWLFAWNPFDWTCRDKVNTIGGANSGDGNRVNNDRRMDIFREPGEITWRHFSVSGKPCRGGSGCKQNLVTGFYSCELEGGEIGSWDYCCKSDHPCGYSQGFDYPWCFVGDQPDQWRTCSDRYFPSNKTRPSVTYSPNKKNKGEIFQAPPRPGGLQSIEDVAAARLWPVTYLYSSGPPNSTELSNFVDCNKEKC